MPTDAARATIAALDLLLAEAPELGRRLPPGWADATARYVDLLLAANRRMNLTRVIEPGAIARDHLLGKSGILQFPPYHRKDFLHPGRDEVKERVSGNLALRAAVDGGERDFLRAACVLVSLDGGRERQNTADAPPIEGTTGQIAARLSELAEAGADEAILVVSPINERSVRELGDVVAALNDRP